MDVENVIVDTLQRIFPNDGILAEEGYSDGAIGAGRVWIIDPICGTANLGHSISAYCSNIALAVNGKLVASCVVDLMTCEYYWSVGMGKIWCGDEEYQTPPRVPGVLVDVDLGASVRATQSEKRNHLKGLAFLQEKTDYMLCSMKTSLACLYVALHRIDGMYCMNTKPWDIAAAAFLMRQARVVIKDLQNNDFTLDTHSYVAARSTHILDNLLLAFAD